MDLSYLSVAVEDFASLSAAAYLVPGEAIVFALAADGVTGEEFVFTTGALLLVKRVASLAGQPATSIKRHEYHSSTFRDATFKAQPKPSRENRASKKKAVAAAKVAPPRFSVSFQLNYHRIITMNIREERVALAYYKAIVVLVRQLARSEPDYVMLQRMVLRTAIDSAFDSPMATNLLTLD